MTDTDFECELDVTPSRHPLAVYLSISPVELELALATHGASLREAMMRAIIAALAVDADSTGPCGIETPSQSEAA
ncbi:MAG: hypothetical protein ACRECX_11240 [Methyloceanibacter sp.]|uniref:hypothetical protein n=1 Tax=Methyloceanibacter sp. TaxID=1965321 RepID=UPI003D6CABE9